MGGFAGEPDGSEFGSADINETNVERAGIRSRRKRDRGRRLRCIRCGPDTRCAPGACGEARILPDSSSGSRASERPRNQRVGCGTGGNAPLTAAQAAKRRFADRLSVIPIQAMLIGFASYADSALKRQINRHTW
ncbi:hypothetical protein EMIT0158MI4_70140 [Burkholderia ambifaria]